MPSKKLRVSLALVSLLLLPGCVMGGAPQTPVQGSSTPAPRAVMTWVAPYAVKVSKARLNESFQGIGMKDGLSDLALSSGSPRPTAAPSSACSAATTPATQR